MSKLSKVFDEIKDRRSIRKYKSIIVKDKDILQIIEAARLAPSGSNTQPWRFLIIRDNKMKNKIASLDHNQKWMLTAPVFIVCLADIKCRVNDNDTFCLTENSPEPELKLIIRDTSIAITHMMVEAEHIGLGTCWTGWFDQKEMREAIEVPDNLYICGVITIGYADEKPEARPRKSIEEIVRYEKW